MPEFAIGLGGGAAPVFHSDAARLDYLWLQAFDLPAAVLFVVAAATAGAIFARRLKAPLRMTRPLAAACFAFFLLELVENALLAALAGGASPGIAALVTAQQAATTLKFAAGAAMVLIVLAIVGAALPRMTGTAP